MTPEETLRVCRLAKALSPAQAVDEYMPEAWHVVLKPWRCEDALLALEQLGGEQEWIHVSHIVGRIKRIRRDRVLDYGTPPDPPRHIDPDDGPAYRTWLAATNEAIADGTYQPPAPEAIGPRRDVIRELGQAQSVDSALAARPLREAHAEAKRQLQEAAAQTKRDEDAKRAKREAAAAADRAARAGHEGDHAMSTTHPDPAEEA